MGLRYRRSVRLFPGVRLNFSRSGVSTSIGVRGASVTIGPRGTYANVGLPGSGLSYRTRLDGHTPVPYRPTPATPYRSHDGSRSPIRTPGVASIPGTEVQIKSAPVEVLTTEGLGELKALINEAYATRRKLRAELAERRKALNRAAGRLGRAEALVIRLFTAKSITRLVEEANNANDDVDEANAHLDGCYVEVDFAFDGEVHGTWQELTKAFEVLNSADRIWDVSTTASVDRVKQRTTASTAYTRKPVSFDFSTIDIVRSKYKGLKLGAVDDAPLQIYPGFAMVGEPGRDFALIEYPKLECKLASSNYIEEEYVPHDAELISYAWKRSNKDGSQDRRFNDNYQIPVLRYGALVLASQTGLAKAFQVSSHIKAAGFAHAFVAHQRALSEPKPPSKDTLALPSPSVVEETTDHSAEAVFVAKPRTYLPLDWFMLVILLVGLGWGGVWIKRHWSELASAFAQPPPVVAPTPAATQAPPMVHKATPQHRPATKQARAVADIASPAPEERPANQASEPPKDLDGLY
jgi:hypothetical protein